MNNRLSVPLAVAFGIATSVGFASLAAADSTESAEAALKRGNSAMKAGRVAEACAAYDKSMKLDPEISTRLKLAKCYEQEGKLVAAARLYRDAADDDGNPARRQTSTAKAAALEAKAPRLRLTLTAEPEGLKVKVDGIEVPADDDVLVDIGPHVVVAVAPGYYGKSSVPIDREKQILDVIVRVEPVTSDPGGKAAKMPAKAETTMPAPAAEEAQDDEAEESTTTATESMKPMAAKSPKRSKSSQSASTSHRTRNGILLGAGGLGLLVGSGILFKLSEDKFDEERALCPASQCRNSIDLGKARGLIDDARLQRGFSIGMGIGGGLALAVGAYLLLRPSGEHNEEQPALSVSVDGSGTNVVYTRGF